MPANSFYAGPVLLPDGAPDSFTPDGTEIIPIVQNGGVEKITLSGMRQYVRGFGYNEKDYGAVGDGVTDDTAAIQSVITAIKGVDGSSPRGGIIYFPKGTYKCASGLDAQKTVGIVFQGEAASVYGGNYTPASQLMFTGTGSGRFIDARSTDGFTIRGLGVRYNNSGFTGTLIDFGHNVSGSDAGAALLDSCLIGSGGGGITTAAILIDLQYAIFCTINNCHVAGGVVGIEMTHGGTLYSNAHRITNCTFDFCTDSAIQNAGEGIFIAGNTFEQTSDLLGAAYKDTGTSSPVGLSFIGNWMGDLSGDGIPTWMILYFPRGAYIAGNTFNGTPSASHISIDHCWGVTIVGNLFGGVTVPVAFGAGTSTGVLIAGNSMVNSAAMTGITAASKLDFAVYANTQDQANPQPKLLTSYLDTQGGVSAFPTNGAVSDASFSPYYQPGDGALAVDRNNNRLYVRVGSTWKYATLT